MIFLRTISILAFLIASPLSAGGICDGRYARGEEILDAAYGKYGTLYPGGERGWRYPNHLGGLIDVYRILAGLPDLEFRDKPHNLQNRSAGSSEFPAYYFDWFSELPPAGRKEALEFVVHAATRSSDIPLSRQTRDITKYYLNRMTLPGEPGWWLDKDMPEPDFQNRFRAYDAQIPIARPIIAQVADKKPFLDWVQYTLAASQLPSSIVWRYRPDSYYKDEIPGIIRTTLSEKVERYQSLEWDVLYQVFFDTNDNNRFSMSKVLDCEANDTEYVATMIASYERMRRRWNPPRDQDNQNIRFGIISALPDKMAEHAIRNMVLITLKEARGHRYGNTAKQTLTALSNYIENEYFKGWMNVARSYLATDIDEIIELHTDAPISGFTYRLLNLFSVADLQKFSDTLDDRPEDQAIFLKAIATRQFALGDSPAAKRTLDRLAEIDPETAPKRHYTGPFDVQITLRILDLDRPSVWLRGGGGDTGIELRMQTRGGYDLTGEFQTGSFLNRDYASYMLQTGKYYAGTNATYREKRRRMFPNPPVLEPFIGTGPDYNRGFPVLRLFDWDEVHRLSVCNGLSKRLAEVIINWADDGTDTWLDRLFAPKDEMAAALQRIINMGRNDSGALVNGRPAGQQAMWLLITRFSDTGEQTGDWYFEDHGCRR